MDGPTDVSLKVWSLLFDLLKQHLKDVVPEGHFQHTNETHSRSWTNSFSKDPSLKPQRVVGEV